MLQAGRTPRVRTQFAPSILGTAAYYKNGSFLRNLSGNEVSYWYSVMEDYVTHNYHQRKARGEVLFNSMSWEFTKTSSEGFGTYVSTSKFSPYPVYTINGDVTAYEAGRVSPSLSSQLPHYSKIDELVDEAKLSALAAVDEAPFGFGEDLGEVRETLRHLRNPLGGLRTLSEKFKRSRSRKIKRKLKSSVSTRKGRWKDQAYQARILADATASTWLEYRFAVAPLVRSAVDLTHALTTIRPQPLRSVARGFARHESSESEDKKYTLSTSSHYALFPRVRTESDVVKAGILYEVSNPLSDVNYTLGLRPSDIPYTMWQLVPYSFMVDRVLDISSAIRGLTNLANPNVRLLTGWVTHKRERKCSYNCTAVEHPSYDTTVKGEKLTHHTFDFSRNGWTPSVADTVPRFNPGGLVDDATKIADLAALVWRNFT